MTNNDEYREETDYCCSGISTDQIFNDAIQEEKSKITFRKENPQNINAIPRELFKEEIDEIDEIKTPQHFNLDDHMNTILMDLF